MVTDLNGNRDSQQKIFELFDLNLGSLSHQCEKRATIGDVLKDGNLQIHEETIDNANGEKQLRQNSGPGIMRKLTVGIKRYQITVMRLISRMKLLSRQPSSQRLVMQ